MKKLCLVATIPAVVHTFMRGHIEVSARKWPVHIISDPHGAELLNDLDAQFIPLAIERKVSLWRDLSALIHLVIIFRRERFNLVHSIMPKTGLLAMLAGWIVGIPNRMHTFTGQVWATERGWRRIVFKFFDKLIVLFATHILVDSPSQRDFLVAERVLAENKGVVIGHGSICGIDRHQFHPDVQTNIAIRTDLDIGLDQIIILFLGRLTRDKGVRDLATAFSNIASYRGDVVLVLVGAEEDISFTCIQEVCGEHCERLRKVNFTPNPERYMAAADIFCLPSYREGFGQVIIEAAASGVPAVASRIYGITDAVDDGKTGLLFPPGDIVALTQSLQRLIEDPVLRHGMGIAAQERALVLFDSDAITNDLLNIYKKIMV